MAKRAHQTHRKPHSGVKPLHHTRLTMQGIPKRRPPGSMAAVLPAAKIEAPAGSWISRDYQQVDPRGTDRHRAEVIQDPAGECDPGRLRWHHRSKAIPIPMSHSDQAGHGRWARSCPPLTTRLSRSIRRTRGCRTAVRRRSVGQANRATGATATVETMENSSEHPVHTPRSAGRRGAHQRRLQGTGAAWRTPAQSSPALAPASGPSATTYRRASSGTANGHRTRPRTWASAAAEPIVTAPRVSAGPAPATNCKSTTSGSIARALTAAPCQRTSKAGPPAAKRQQNLHISIPQDPRIVERATQLEEGQIERDRHPDEQDGRHDFNRQRSPGRAGPAASRRHP